MKEQVQKILSSDKDYDEKLQEIRRLLSEIVKDLDERNVKPVKRRYTPEAVSIDEFEPIGLFAD
ncbi:MAG: hypothetical protein HXX16_06795 [Bacteroidales bacterium]|nr:hypothetical protein [Bacteroidales bacterium]